MGDLVHAGMPVPQDEAQKLFCEAYKTAYKKYCETPHPRGYFNNYFFDALRNTSPPKGADLAAATIREAPVFVTGAAGAGAGMASTAASIGSAHPMAQALAGGYQSASQALAGASQVTGAFTGLVPSGLGLWRAIGEMGGPGRFFGALRAEGVRLRYPDGLVGNPPRTLEIKGPFDKERPGQFDDNKIINGGEDQGFMADKSCYAEGEEIPPCKKGRKK